eukprot:TRINITY_DN10712_c0_g1_i1.p1 TRINITY_DN10712_c0_g1~~TRINITY_DN10712_c0_g1_i1.p1  ORF type:complete len:462 (+),score=82.20 TRINITY_DN10712_c0_g1_i1:49-1434(+)
MYRFSSSQVRRVVSGSVRQRAAPRPFLHRHVAQQYGSSLRAMSSASSLLASSRTQAGPAVASSAFPTRFARFYSGGEPIEFLVPGMGDSITEGAVEQWHVDAGGAARTDELIATIETDKISNEIRAPEDLTVVEHCAGEGDTVFVGGPLFKFTKGCDGAAPAAPAAATPDVPTPAAPAASSSAVPPPPPRPSAGGAMAPPTAPPAAAAAKPSPSSSSAPSAAATAVTGARTESRVGMNRMRQRIAQRLKDSQNTFAMLTTFQECDMTGLMELRSEYKDAFVEKHGVKLGFMSAFVKASASALSEIPVVNAVIDGNEIVYRDYVDISVAVATPKGLVVPVLRNCENMSFADVERNIGELGARARKGQIAMEDMAGGTFTISNGGVYGSLMGTPIINPPQSSILGMHGINKRPVAIGDKVEIRPMMYLALTYDHRLIDGREAVTFLRSIKHNIEDPRRMLLDL